jgi:pilus assembly protein CpaB
VRRFHQALPPQIRRWRVPIALGITIATLLWVAAALGRKGTPTELPSVPVVIARTSIPAHTVLHPEVVAPWNSRPPVPEGAFTNPRDVQGLLTLRDLQPGEVITRAAVAPPEKLFGAAAMVPPGMRAVTIVVQGSQGFDGRLTPGALVDVITVMARPQAPEARTILTGARVLYVKSTTSPGQGALGGIPGAGGVEVTLAVPPELTPSLALAQAHGQVMLALHSARDASSPASKEEPLERTGTRRPRLQRRAPAYTPTKDTRKEARWQAAPPKNIAALPTLPPQVPIPQSHRTREIELILGEQRLAIPLQSPGVQGGQEP